MEVFVTFDPADAERAAGLVAAWSAASKGTTFTWWVSDVDSDRSYINLPGSAPRFYDTSWRPLIEDKSKIRRAAGVLVLVTERAAESGPVVASVESAYGLGKRVVAVQVDEGAALPRNISNRQVVTADYSDIARLLADWERMRQETKSLPWWSRLKKAIRADRDARR